MSPPKTQKPSKKVRILPFLRGLLEDPFKSNIICWTNKAKLEFRMVDNHKVAELWGATKPGRKVKVMSYSNMARSLRPFVKNGELEKMNGNTCGYRFVEPSANLSFDLESQVTRSPSPSDSSPSPTPSQTSLSPASSESGTYSSPDDVPLDFTSILLKQSVEFSDFLAQLLSNSQ